MKKSWFSAILLILGMALNSEAELIYGYADTLYCVFDFSEGECRPDGNQELGDLQVFEFRPGPEVGPEAVIFSAIGGIIDMGEKPLNELTVAPDPAEVNYLAGAPDIIEGHSYVVRTVEGHFTKIFVTSFDFFNAYALLFDWVYQNDGSRNLDTTTVIEVGTWGKVKAFFKRLL